MNSPGNTNRLIRCFPFLVCSEILTIPETTTHKPDIGTYSRAIHVLALKVFRWIVGIETPVCASSRHGSMGQI